MAAPAFITRRMTVAIGFDGADICTDEVRDSKKSKVTGRAVGERDCRLIVYYRVTGTEKSS